MRLLHSQASMNRAAHGLQIQANSTACEVDGGCSSTTKAAHGLQIQANSTACEVDGGCSSTT